MSFSQLCNLKSHKRTHIHMWGMWNVICTTRWCQMTRVLTRGRSCRTAMCTRCHLHSSVMLKHRCTLTRKKPYTCNVGHKGFSHLTSLRVHKDTQAYRNWWPSVGLLYFTHHNNLFTCMVISTQTNTLYQDFLQCIAAPAVTIFCDWDSCS